MLAGDMLLDFDLSDVISRHTARQDLATLVLLEDSRADRFGSIGIGKGGAVRRIASSLDLGGETAAGLFTGVRVFSREALERFPEVNVFEDVRDWMLPELTEGNDRIRGEIYSGATCTWEPVGTLDEYLHANMEAPPRCISTSMGTPSKAVSASMGATSWGAVAGSSQARSSISASSSKTNAFPPTSKPAVLRLRADVFIH